MHILLVFCHPRRESFCAALRDSAVAALMRAGHTVEIQDLYAEKFSPALEAEERALYYEESRNSRGVHDYVTALQRAEGLLLVYPTWWFGMPAMLKGWIDRVWLPGVAFSLNGRGGLDAKLSLVRRIAVITTYGAPRWVLWYVGWPDWRVINRGLRSLCAKGCRLDWIALNNMDTCTLADRQKFVAKVEARLVKWH